MASLILVTGNVGIRAIRTDDPVGTGLSVSLKFGTDVTVYMDREEAAQLAAELLNAAKVEPVVGEAA